MERHLKTRNSSHNFKMTDVALAILFVSAISLFAGVAVGAFIGKFLL